MLLSLYSRMMRAHPAKTQILTTGCLMLTGDVIAQKAIEKRESLDVGRAARFFVLGIGFVGPTIRTWYVVLERVFGARGGVLRKVLVDQLIFSPVFVASFLTCLGFLQRRPWSDTKQMLRKDYVPILTTGYMLWPAAQLVNFHLVPLPYRLPFASGVGLVWNTYLAWKANKTPST
uniref:Mitochondrial inner membrane protein Mpv17 n=1 Tax=Ixodes ricinus TaxID=34613 RepID=A0A131XZZ0_IXORI